MSIISLSSSIVWGGIGWEHPMQKSTKLGGILNLYFNSLFGHVGLAKFLIITACLRKYAK